MKQTPPGTPGLVKAVSPVQVQRTRAAPVTPCSRSLESSPVTAAILPGRPRHLSHSVTKYSVTVQPVTSTFQADPAEVPLDPVPGTEPGPSGPEPVPPGPEPVPPGPKPVPPGPSVSQVARIFRDNSTTPEMDSFTYKMK